MSEMISDQLTCELLEQARRASKNAYCNYSNFPVGAAILTANGEIYSGCNIENASFGLTICAERTAIFNAVSGGDQQIQAVVIYTPTPCPTAPCGACRQVINEFGPNAMVISFCDGVDEIQSLLNDLLPSAFGSHDITSAH